MRKLAEMIGDLIDGDPRILAGFGVVIAIVIGGIVYARVTRARRLKAKAKIVRRRD